jgi:hypothetical protein
MLARRIVWMFGFILVVASLFFVFHRIWVNRLWAHDWQPTGQMVLVIVAGAVAYAASCFLLSLAWHRLLVWLGETDVCLRESHIVYARTQIAKYIPGNVFQYVGRQVLGKQGGILNASLALATTYEIISLLFASSAVAVVSVVFFTVRHDGDLTWKIAGVLLAAFSLQLTIGKVLPFFSKSCKLDAQAKIIDVIRGLGPINLLHTAFFLALGCVFLGITLAFSDIEDIRTSAAVVTTLAVSWIAGYIVPGAPAGLGIREAVIVASLSKFIGEPNSLSVALIYRVITLLGDLLFFLSSFVKSASCRVRA